MQCAKCKSTEVGKDGHIVHKKNCQFELELKIVELQDLCIWMTGCGYDFGQHKYFREGRDKLLKN